ncbi:hypothetical protein [Planococcus halocryophilus]|uniref:hypothetical protein n=1 Tax=Planococcus halocryophilus TaxID=1215089 RepID=UPI001F0F188F|nr:hypothetical protein [Planococcus halocryophilus]MCH4826353.1 hypothetical protein [Planococcus halocryophilus]
MLNNRQKQFRKHMKELERGDARKKDVYSYRDQRFTSEKPKKRFKKPFLQIGGGISLIVLLWNVFALSTWVWPGNGLPNLMSANQVEVHEFIQASTEIEMNLTTEAVALVNQYNAKTLTPFHIEEAQKNLFQLQKSMKTEDARFLQYTSYLDEQFKLAYQLTNVLKTEESNVKYAELTGIIERQNALLEIKNNALRELLDSEDISYNQLEDGSINYEVEM